ncbi:MAG: ATP synthase F1 subunit epsilon [Candidatus Saccharimonadales bacterium]
MLNLELVTLHGPKFQEEVYEVILPTADGMIAVYPHHMPLVSQLVSGVISVRRKKSDVNEQVEYFATNGGVAEIGSETVRVLVDEADHAEELVEQEEQAALERAKQLKAEAKDEVELEHATTLVDRQAVRLKVAQLRRHRGQKHIPSSQ